MATIFGLTPEGWAAKPIDVVLDELDSDLLGILGDSAGTESDGSIPLESLAGQQKAALADGFTAMWDLLQGVVSAFDPNQAEDAQLDAVCALTGTTRDAESFSEVTITCTGTQLTVLPLGRIVKTADTGDQFASTAAATLAQLPTWAGTHAYVAGDRVTNASRSYQCTTGGTSAGSGGPTTTSSSISDNTVTWEYLGDGAAVADVAYEALVAGPVGATAGQLTVIVTPVDGWSSCRNLLDAAAGADQETNPALRARREAELAGQGGSTADAIRAKILKVNEGSTDGNHLPPTSCTVFVNDTNSTNSDGLPPHSVEVLVQNGTDADIAQAVFEAVGAGTATYSSTGNSSTVTDSQGNAQVVYWSRPVPINIYVTATVYYDASQWPTGTSTTLVAQTALSALLTYGQTFAIGLDVRAAPLQGAIINKGAATDVDGVAVVPAPAGSVATPGVLDVTPITFGTTVSPVTSTPVSISTRQIAVFDSTRCTITAVAETP